MNTFSGRRHVPPRVLVVLARTVGSGLTDAAGEPVSKSQRKKLKKRLDVHAKKWAGAATAA